MGPNLPSDRPRSFELGEHRLDVWPCLVCGENYNRYSISGHVCYCQRCRFVRELSKSFSKAVLDRGRAALVKRLACDITEGSIDSIGSILDCVSRGIKDICITAKTGSWYPGDPALLDKEPWRHKGVLLALGRSSQLRNLWYRCWPTRLDLMRELLPQLPSMAGLRVLRMSFLDTKSNRPGDTWKRMDPVPVLILTEIHLHDISWRYLRTIAHLLASSPQLECLSICWKFLESDKDDTLSSEGESIGDETAEGV